MNAPTIRIVIPGDDPPQLQGSPHLKRLRALGEVRLQTDRPADDAEKVRRCQGATCLINSRGAVKWPGHVLEQLPDLRMITTCGIGTDSIDLETAQRRGIIVCNLPGRTAPIVAEHAFALMFAVARRTAWQTQQLKQGRLVFVSHSARDTWVARQIARETGECGAEPFLDEAEIEVGGDFEEEILTFLDKADELVVLMTPWAQERPYVWAELGAAWSRRILIVILLQGMTPGEFQSRPGIPVFLKQRNMVDLNAIDEYLAQLRKRVRQ